MTSNELATIEHQALDVQRTPQLSATLASVQYWSQITNMAQAFHQSGLLPKEVKNWQGAALVMQAGLELGIGFTTAFRWLHVISGKVAINAAGMSGLIYQTHGDSALIPVESTEETCTYKYKRRDWKDYATFTYTIDDAKKAGLLGNDTWKKFPRDMLRSRCIGVIARMAFQDVLGGLYQPEELGANVTVSPDGDIHVVEAPLPERTVTSDGETVDDPATQAQVKKISVLKNELDIPDEQFKTVYLEELYGVTSRKDLTKQQASDLIELLTVLQFEKSIQAVNSDAALDKLADEIRTAKLEGDYLTRVRSAFKRRREALKVEPDPVAEDDEELDAAWEEMEAENVGT